MDEQGSPSIEQSVFTVSTTKIQAIGKQRGIPFWEAEWISCELKEILFGQPSKNYQLRTYLIVDAALRQNVTGYFDLDMPEIDLPKKCLVKGQALRTSQESAPFLIDMSLTPQAFDDNEKVPSFHKDFFKKHWGHNTGIFIRTTELMEEVWQHLRRFIRMQIEADKTWVFFRFWDPRILPSYFNSIHAMPEKVAQWVNMRNGTYIHSILCEQADVEQVWHFTPLAHKLLNVKPAAIPTLSKPEMEGIERYRIYRYEQRASAFFKKQFAQLTTLLSSQQITAIIQLAYENAKKRDIISEKHHFKYLIIAANWGSAFESDPQFQAALQDVHWADIEYANFEMLFAKVDERIAARNEDLAQPKRVVLGFERIYSQPIGEITQASVCQVLQKIWPAQYKQLSAESLYQFVDKTCEFAQSHFRLIGSDLVTYIALAMHFGSEFGVDPIYPWASEALALEDPETRRHALGRGVVAYFKSQGRLT